MPRTIRQLLMRDMNRKLNMIRAGMNKETKEKCQKAMEADANGAA